jgi:sortase A
MRGRLFSGRAAIERSLVSVGVALLVFAAGAKLMGEVQKQRDLKRFRAALLATGNGSAARETGSADAATNPDTSLWSPERIKAWEESLRKDFGAPVAILAIPKIGLEVPVLEGTDDVTLNRAVGLIEGTPRPGEVGNAGVAGHRDGFFRGLKDVGVGDTIEVQSLAARHTFVVEFIRIVGPEEVSVLAASSAPTLTLVTCYPFYFVGSAPQRYIVRAVKRDVAVPTEPVRSLSGDSHSGNRKEASSPRRN